MPLSEQQLANLRAVAQREGVSEDELIAAAQEVVGEAPASQGRADPGGAPVRPVADRLLVGFLPFIKVKELRSIWLGLDDPVVDDDLTIADWRVKHGEVSLRAGPDGGDE